MPQRQSDPFPTWKSFLKYHLGQTVALDFFVVPTLTFRILFVLVIVADDRSPELGLLWNCRKSAGYTIVTNDTPPEPTDRP